MRNRIINAALLGLATVSTGAHAASPSHAALQASQAAPATGAAIVSEGLRTRANQLVDFLNGKLAPTSFFEAGSETKFTPERVAAVQTAVRDRLGAALSVSGVEADGPHAAVATLNMERGVMRVRLGVSQEAPHGVIELKPAR